MEQMLIPEFIAELQRQTLAAFREIEELGKMVCVADVRVEEAKRSLSMKKKMLEESEIVRECLKQLKETEEYKTLAEAKYERKKAVEALPEFTAWTDATNSANTVRDEWATSKTNARQIAYKLAGATNN